MKRFGFTLVELLAIIVVLGLVVAVSAPTINNIIKRSKEKAYNEQVDRIVGAFKTYVVKNSSTIGENSFSMTLEELKNTEFMEKINIKDPRDNEIMDGCLIMIRNEDKMNYEYRQEKNSCGNE